MSSEPWGLGSTNSHRTRESLSARHARREAVIATAMDASHTHAPGLSFRALQTSPVNTQRSLTSPPVNAWPGCSCRPAVKYLSRERSEATESHISSGARPPLDYGNTDTDMS